MDARSGCRPLGCINEVLVLSEPILSDVSRDLPVASRCRDFCRLSWVQPSAGKLPVSQRLSGQKDLLHQSASLGVESRTHCENGEISRSDDVHLPVRKTAVRSEWLAHGVRRSSNDRRAGGKANISKT